MKTIAFLSLRAGAGNTTLVYHLAWMYRELGLRVVAADLDPQANLSAMFLDETRLEELWSASGTGRTLLAPLLPLFEGEGGIEEPHVESIEGIGLLAGDLGLAAFEDELSRQWPRCLNAEEHAFSVITGFSTILAKAAAARQADLVLMDVGPNLGAINRAAMLAAGGIVIPLAPDPFSLIGLQILGPRLREWRAGWRERLEKKPPDVAAPAGRMRPLGYVVMPDAGRPDRSFHARARWMAPIPSAYRAAIEPEPPARHPAEDDPHCLATINYLLSLMPLARLARKPMFLLKPADGALGVHAEAVQHSRREFEALARRVAREAGLALP